MNQTHALIIDDNIRNMNVLSMLLSEHGVSTTQVINPAKLETILQGMDKTDVIFLDLEMPDKSGYEVFDLLKTYTRFQHVPVIAYTVHVSEINAVHQQGFDGFIGKPLDPDRFPDQLARILNGQPVWEVA